MALVSLKADCRLISIPMPGQIQFHLPQFGSLVPL